MNIMEEKIQERITYGKRTVISHISVVSKKKIKICFTYQDEFDDMCYLIQKMKGEHEIWQG